MEKNSKKNKNRGMNRREFLKAGVGGAVGLAALNNNLLGKAYVFGADQPPIKIGHVAVLTGLFGVLGTGGLHALKVFEKQVNEQGGILGRKVVIVSRDTAARPANAVIEIKRAVTEDKIDFIITTDSSGVILAETPVAKEMKALVIHSTASTTTFQNICNRYAFRTGETTKFFVYGMAKITATKNPEVRRWVGINPDYEWGHVCWEGFQKYLKILNPSVEFVGNFYTPFGSADFRPYISKILDLKPDGVITSLWSGELVTFIKQAKMYGFFDKIKRFVDNSSTTIDVSIILGKEMVEVFGTGFYYFGYPDTPQNKKFVNDYRALAKDYPISSSGVTYKSALFLKAAIEKAGTTDKEKVIDALSGITLETPAGGKGWMRPKDHQVQSEYMVAGKTAPDANYPFWIFKDIMLVPGTEGNATEDEIEGCKL